MADNYSLQLATPIIAETVTPNSDDFIKSRIFTIRGVQVMLDRDLAVLYGVGTKVLNQAVKRNGARFPSSFMFQLSVEETQKWKSQIVTSNLSPEDEASVRMGLRRQPYAFTEQGVAMLSAVLRSPTAIEVSVRIMEIFVAMRKALASVAPILARLETAERRQITDQARNEERFDTILKAMDGGDFPPQKVFFNGKHYDAYSFAKKLVRKAEKKHQKGTLPFWRVAERLGPPLLRSLEDGFDVHPVHHAEDLKRGAAFAAPLSYIYLISTSYIYFISTLTLKNLMPSRLEGETSVQPLSARLTFFIFNSTFAWHSQTLFTPFALLLSLTQLLRMCYN